LRNPGGEEVQVGVSTHPKAITEGTSLTAVIVFRASVRSEITAMTCEGPVLADMNETEAGEIVAELAVIGA